MKQNFTYKGLAKLYFIMRVSIVNVLLLLTPCLQVVSASPVNGQNLHDTFVSIDVEHVPLKKIFKLIEDQTGLLFVYAPELVEAYNDIGVRSSHISIHDVLDKTLSGLPISFKESNGNILLFKKTPDDSHNETYQSISGRVIDFTAGIGLPGVSIVIKGTTDGTTTDGEGRYVINANDDDVLIFSFVGFKNQEISVGGRTVIDVQMQEDVASLQEVVVNGGYYTTKVETKLGNIVSVSGKDIKDQPLTSPLMGLQGRAAGVDLYPNSGVPGSGTSIVIRGRNSLRYDGSFPLYVVDGVPVDSSPVPSYSSLVAGHYDPLASLNPADIESITILKDADATAIYGSRAANGVVLITTKGAVQGKTAADFSIYRGVGRVANKLDLLKTAEYLNMRREAFRNNNNEEINEFNASDLVVWDTTRYTDWQNEIMGETSDIIDFQGGVSGGGANTSFRLSGGYHRETTIFPGDFYFHRITGNFSLNHFSADKKFHATVSANYGATKNHFFDASSPVYEAFRLAPNAPALYNDDGTLNWELNSMGESTWTNPLANFRRTNDMVGGNLMFNSSFSYNIGYGVTAKVNTGYTDLSSSETLVVPLSSSDPAFVQYYSPERQWTNTTRRSWIVEPQLLFGHRFGSHGIEAILGSTFQEGSSNVKNFWSNGYASDALVNSLQGAGFILVQRDDASRYRYTSAFARISYDFREKYLINLTARRDGSSRFGQNNRFGNFGSIGAGWIFSKEKMISEVFPFISFGKLRGSVGTTGNDQIGDYRYLNTYQATTGKYQGVYGLVPTSLFNPDYKWEVSKKIEAALELNLFNDRVTMEIAWYRNRSSNLIIDYQLPGATGFTSILKNLDALVENRGFEYTASVNLINTGDFRWSVNGNYSRPRNELVKFEGLENSSYASTYVVGWPLSVSRMYKYTGVNPETGVYTFLDVDDNGRLDNEDQVVTRNVGRTYFGGIGSNVSFKGFELSFLFQFVKQTMRAITPGNAPGQMGNLPREWYDNRWRNTGDISQFQKVSTDPGLMSPFYSLNNSDVTVESASFLRLKTLSLSYSLNPGLMRKIKLMQCRMFLQAQNVFTVTEYSGLDPETGSLGIPPLKMFSLGLQLGI